MNETVAQADDLRPGDFGMERAHIFRNTTCRFAHNLQQTNQGQIQKLVSIEVGARLPPASAGRLLWRDQAYGARLPLGSRLLILRLRFGLDLGAKVRAEKIRRVQINLPPQDF